MGVVRQPSKSVLCTTNWKEAVSHGEGSQFFGGIHIMMRILKFPQAGMYRAPSTRVEAIAGSMARGHLFKVRNILHVANNLHR